MPLTESVRFKGVLQRGNRFQLPRTVRWGFKLECDQVLKVMLKLAGGFGEWETFYARMDKSGRITVPKLTRQLLLGEAGEGKELARVVVEVTLEPV